MNCPSFVPKAPLTLIALLCFAVPLIGQTTAPATKQPPTQTVDTVTLDEIVLPRVATENFENGIDRWTMTDPSAWSVTQLEDGTHAFGLNRRQSDYQPKHRSPLNIALMSDIQVSDFVLTFDVRTLVVCTCASRPL